MIKALLKFIKLVIVTFMKALKIIFMILGVFLIIGTALYLFRDAIQKAFSCCKSKTTESGSSETD